MKSNKAIVSIILIFLIIGLGFFIYRYFMKSDSNSLSENYSGQKISSNKNMNDYTNNSSSANTTENTNLNSNDVSQTDNQKAELSSEPEIPSEEEISSFSTKIYTKDSERQNNISITISTLNDTVVNAGDTFSFCDTVGKATSSKGYEKADVFKDGEIVHALGGGNCQVSTTLYNAVLNVPSLEITERHSHSNSVPYIESGKDAAVAYGSYDFKFINHNDYNIKIKAENTENEVIIKLLKLNS